MTCQEVADFLMDYLNGELSRTQHAVFEEHLGICPECVAFLQTYKIAIKAAKMACNQVHNRDVNDIPEDLVRAILDARMKPV